MAIVPVEITTVGRDRGYPIEQVTTYVYCDRCGSFRIRSRISLKTWAWIAVSVLVTFGLWILTKDAAAPGYGWFCWSSFAIVLVGVIVENKHRLAHKCMNCGNTVITGQNILHYPEYDKEALKVPEHVAHKHYFVN